MRRLHSFTYITRIMIFMFLLIAFFFPLAASAHQYDDPPKNILVIFSYSPSYPSSPLLLNGLYEALEDQNVNLHIEYMDSKIVNTQESRDLFFEQLKLKLNYLNPIDLVIAFDDNALIFVDGYYEQLFDSGRQIPVVFDGCNDYEATLEIYQRNPNFTGRFEGTSRFETIEMAIKLIPEYQSINIIIDDSTTAVALQKQLVEYNPKGYAIDFIQTTNYTFEALGDYLLTLTREDILIFAAGYIDAVGQRMTFQQMMQFLQEHTTIPIFCNQAYNIEDVFAGGYVPNKELDGNITGETACQILFKGKAPSDFGLDENTNQTMSYMYNASILKDYNIALNALPSDAVLINSPRTIAIDNPKYIIIFIAVCAVLGVIISLLITYAIQNRHHAIQHEKVAQTDHLTNAGSRMAFYIKTKRMIDECIISGTKSTLIFFDLDHFKEINDKHGHTVGDIVLQATIKRIQNTIKSYGEIFRYGGDEFIILLSIGGRSAMPYIKKIIRSFDHPIRAEGQIIPISLSMGAVEIPTHGTKINDLVVKADAAMYRAKEYEFSRAVFHIDDPIS